MNKDVNFSIPVSTFLTSNSLVYYFNAYLKIFNGFRILLIGPQMT